MLQFARIAACSGVLLLGACSGANDGARGATGGATSGAGAGGVSTGGATAVGGNATGGGGVSAGGGGAGGTGGQVMQPPHGRTSMGYVGQLNSGVDALDLSAVKYVIQAFYSADAGSGSIADVWNVDQYAAAGLRTKAAAAGTGVILSFGGSNHSDPLKQIAKNAGVSATFAQNVVNKIKSDNLAGVDLDIEFPAGGSEPDEHYNLVATVYDAVKANNPKDVVVFGVSPGYYLDQFQWAKLATKSDYAFYFCYDWSNPALGPMQNPGVFMKAMGGATFEASCKGAIDYIVSQGYPAEKIVLGIGFYATGGAPYSQAPSSVKAATPDSLAMEVLDGNTWWPSAASVKAKMDAVLSPTKTVLDGGKTAGGVGFWEWGFEDPNSPDLSQAMKQQLATY